jgi:hypothetical protein
VDTSIVYERGAVEAFEYSRRLMHREPQHMMNYCFNITYKCNQKCPHCYAFCHLDIPDKDDMSLEQVGKVVSMLKAEFGGSFTRRSFIDVLGGEPLVHPDVFEIVELLVSLKKEYGLFQPVYISTNGSGSLVKNNLKRVVDAFGRFLKVGIKGDESRREHYNVMVAPVDTPASCFAKCKVDPDHNYGKFCETPTRCGVAIDAHGFYPCSYAASIDRMFGFNVGIKHHPTQEELDEVKRILCKFCHRPIFTAYGTYNLKTKISVSWQKAIDNWNQPIMEKI